MTPSTTKKSPAVAATSPNTKLVGRVAAAAESQDSVPREPNLHPVLGVVNKGTIFLTSTPVLNAFKSWFWGLFAGEEGEGGEERELVEREGERERGEVLSFFLFFFFFLSFFLLLVSASLASFSFAGRWMER